MIKHIKKSFLISCLWLLLAWFLPLASSLAEPSGLHVECPSELAVGDPFLLIVSSPVTVDDVNVVWLDKTISLRGQGQQAELLLPVPLETKEETLPLLLLSAEDGIRIFSSSISVKQKEFPVQSLKVDPRFVTPSKETLPRIERETKQLRDIYATFTPERSWRLPLQRPLPGVITAEFGVRRVFNDKPRNRHRGVDFRGTEGTEIRSLAAGKVMFAGNTYYGGNVVVVDHGLGVHTSYSHLSAFRVETGDMVDASTLLGLVGSTGRVTGPHLHLGLMVQGVAQTPEPFMPDFRTK